MDTTLLQLGILLFLFGLITGLFIPKMANPRMGLSSRLEAGSMMPIAGLGRQGTSVQEGIIAFLLTTLGLAMVFVCAVVIVGLG